MSWGNAKLRGALTKRQASTATTLGSRFVKAATAGAIIDRRQAQPKDGMRKRVAVPESLAKFFRPIGGVQCLMKLQSEHRLH